MKITTFLLLLLVACAPAAPGLKIGILAPLTGPVPTCGEDMMMGLTLALDKLNQTKGITLIPIIEDTQFKPSIAVTAAKKLLDVDGVKFLIGDCGSSGTLAVAPLTEERKAILFTPISFADKISEAGDYVFRFATTAREEVPLTVPFVKQLGASKVAIIYLNNDYGLAFRDKFTSAFAEKGGTVVLAEAADPLVIDFRTTLTKIKETEATVIILPASQPQVIAVLKQAKELGMNEIKFISTQVAEHETLLQAIGDFAEGRLFFTSLVELSPEITAKNLEAKAFAELFNKHYPNRIPNTEIMNMYDTTLLLAKALTKCGEDTTCVRDALYAQTSFISATGENSMDSKGDVKHGNIVFKTIKDGKYVRLE